MKTINDLVTDWGGFERLIAKLHETGDVTVEHNVHLKGRSGAPRQIDVLIRHRQGLYEHVVVVECKYWNTAVERLHVDALSNTVKEVGAAKGVIFTTKGFQSGAVTQASHDNIELYTVRELTDEEWGLPGKVIDLFLHVNSISFGNVQVFNMISLAGFKAKSSNLEMVIGSPDTDTRTFMFKEGAPERSLEEYLCRVAQESACKFDPKLPLVLRNGGYEGEMLLKGKVNIVPPKPITIHALGGIFNIPRLEFDVGIVIRQSRLTIDRSSNYFFALAVEDCVRKTSTYATRRADEEYTVLERIVTKDSVNQDDIVKNGSLISVWLESFASFDRFKGLEYGRMAEA